MPISTGVYCLTVRERTFQAMKLQVGSSISCEEHRKREAFFWKQMYSGHWEREKVRLGRVTAKLKELD